VLGSLLLLGLVLGLKHALEADHVSTVATLAARSPSARQTVRVAFAWGLGHATALALVGTALVAVGAALPERVTQAFEMAVGAILIVLGIGVLRRLRRQGLHVHVHQHGGGRPHLHAHAHVADGEPHEASPHEHAHGRWLWGRSLFIGGVHGLAGSAAATVLALAATDSVPRALLYLAVFGAGSIAGMVVLSVVITLPLRLSARSTGLGALGLQALLGGADVALGCFIALQAFDNFR
jgi:hypothetical protein